MKIAAEMRRSTAVLIALLPFACVWSGSIANLFHFEKVAGTMHKNTILSVVPYGALIIGGLFILYNVYSFFHPLLYKLIHRSMDGYKHNSGFPLLGTIGVAFYSICKFPNPEISLYLSILLLVDTGGPLWFVVCTWRQKELWESMF
jgi:hypothetical protein